MSDLDFDALDAVDPPDQWPDILHRSDQPTKVAYKRRSLFVPMAALAAAVVAVAGLVAVVTWPDSPSDPVVDGRPPPSAAVSPEAPFVCVSGELRHGGVPKGAVPFPSVSADTVQPEQQAWSWNQGDLLVEMLLPAHTYIDFLGERTESIGDDGLLWYRDDETRLLASTGLGGDCKRYELTATGGTETDRVTLLRKLAGLFQWDASRGLADCGPLSDPAIQVSEGAQALAAVVDLQVTELPLEPGANRPGSRRADGRCTITAQTQGGLQLEVTVSGNDGETYAIDRIVGFAGDVDPLPSWSGHRSGALVQVDMDYWCDDCAEATRRLPRAGHDRERDDHRARGLRAGATRAPAGQSARLPGDRLPGRQRRRPRCVRRQRAGLHHRVAPLGAVRTGRPLCQRPGRVSQAWPAGQSSTWGQ